MWRESDGSIARRFLQDQSQAEGQGAISAPTIAKVVDPCRSPPAGQCSPPGKNHRRRNHIESVREASAPGPGSKACRHRERTPIGGKPKRAGHKQLLNQAAGFEAAAATMAQAATRSADLRAWGMPTPCMISISSGHPGCSAAVPWR